MLSLLLAAGCSAPLCESSGALPLDSEAAGIIRTLDACGATESGCIGTWPMSYREAARQARAAGERPGLVHGPLEAARVRLRDELAARMSPDLSAGGLQYLRFSVVDTFDHFRSCNDFGREDSGEEVLLRARARSVVGLGGGSSVTLSPEADYGDRVAEGDDAEGRFIEAALRLHFGKWELEYGIDSMWWGPGVHGSLLLTNNAEPFENLFKISNHDPVLLPLLEWPTYFTVFSTRLGDDRADHPDPYLAGMRLELRPRPWMTLGLSRTAVFGGKGRPATDIGMVWDVFLGKGENKADDPGDQRAGLDVTVRIPWKVQPVQVYAEVAGEDEAGMFPSKLSGLGGLYLPRLGKLTTLDLRVEYARTHEVMYTHHIYTDGYTFEDRVIGHHAGTDARDLFVALGWRPIETFSAAVFGDWERRGVSAPVEEKKFEIGLELRWAIDERRAVGVSYVRQSFDNFEQVDGRRETGDRLSAWMTFSF